MASTDTMRLIPLVTAVLLAQQGIPLQGKDIERLNPARVVLDRRVELKLDKAQIAVLDSMRKGFDEAGKRLADEVKKHQRAITTPPPLLREPLDARPETRKDSLERAKLDSTNRIKRDRYFETVTAGRRDLAATLLALKELFDGNVTRTTALLKEDQGVNALLTLEAASSEFTRRLRLANVR